MKRAVPVPSDETAPFWNGCAEGRLRLPTCAACEKHFYPPPPRCPDCGSSQLVWDDLSGRGRLRNWTTVHIPGPAGLAAPFVLAEVELVGTGGTIMTVTLSEEVKAPRNGLPLRIAFHRIEGEHVFVPEFTNDEGVE